MESSRAPYGLVCALREELGTLEQRAQRRTLHVGLEVLEVPVNGELLLACVGGIGKVAAARAATALLSLGARRALLVVGVCGGLKRHLVPGTFVHCTTAVQADFARREGREIPSEPALREAWRALASGPEGWFLTADRPVLSLWRRMRLARAFSGDCVADMETAAVAATAAGAGVPWAALRAVTDRATRLGAFSFHTHFASQAGRAADTVPALIDELSRRSAT
jgi:adenosylhomocysteine nucleosidase